MSKLLTYGLFVIILFGSFFLSGHIGLLTEQYSRSVMAGAASFGVSFIGLISSATKFWIETVV